MKLFYNNNKCTKCGELTNHYIGDICRKCYMKEYRQSHKEEIKANKKEYNTAHSEWLKAYKKEYSNNQKNSYGKTLDSIRAKSYQYLFKTLKHNKLDNYEIHHCFGYVDYTKFIYVPRSLHLKIHQYLRDNKIDAKSEHYRDIVNLINEYTNYTYIHV